MSILKKLIISLLLMFTVITGNADSLDDFISSLSEQAITTQWIYNNSVDSVTLDKASVITKAVYKESLNNELNPHLIVAVIRTESSFNENAQSSEGAKGLMQVIPKWHKDKLKGRNPKNIHVSVEVGTKILNDCMSKNNQNISKSLRCYSGGASDKYKKTVLAYQDSLRKYISKYRNRA